MAILPEQRPEEENSGQNSLANTLGLIIFLLAIGSQFIQPLFSWLGQFIGAGTANRLGSTIPNLLPLLIISLVLLTVVISVVSSIASRVGRMRRDGEPSLPTTPPPASYPMSSDPYPSASSRSTTRTAAQQSYQPGEPAAPNMDEIFPQGRRKQSLPAHNLPRAPLPGNTRLNQYSSMLKNEQVRTPKFEPILDATVLTYGILALLISGALIGGIAMLAGFLP